MQPSLNIAISTDGRFPRLTLAGEFDAWHIDDFDAAIDAVMSEAVPSKLVIDLERVSFLSSMGISGLLRVRALVDEVVLVGCVDQVRRTLDVSGLTKFFTFEPAGFSTG